MGLFDSVWFESTCIELEPFFIPNYRIFALKFFNLKIIFALSIFENGIASKVFTFTFLCAMPWENPVRNIWRSAYGVEYVAVYCTVRLWDRGHNGSLWVHPSTVINIFTESGNISTTTQIPDRVLVPITVSRSCLLVVVYNGWLNIGGPSNSMCESRMGSRYLPRIYRPSYFSRQRDLQQLFHTRHHIPCDIFPKQSGC